MRRKRKHEEIRATSLIGFAELVEDGGADPAALLRAAKIDPLALNDVDRMISYRALAELLEITARQLNRPSLGLEWSLRMPDHFPQFGPVTLLASFVSTVEEWFEVAIEYWRLHTNAHTFLLIQDAPTGLVSLRYQPVSSAYPTRQLCEVINANLTVLIRATLQRPDENPSVVRFQHDRPKDVTLHNYIFRCPVEFNAEHTEIVMEPKVLKYPTSGKLGLLKPILNAYIRHRMNRLADYDGSLTTTVSMTIMSSMSTGRCDISLVAQSLGMNTKALQRRLDVEGTSFSAILDDVRESTARQLLAESDTSIERISGLLGFASTPPFTTAFKRWTGQNPLQFRKAEQSRTAK
jgi:AraC-like DNA-binding protein